MLSLQEEVTNFYKCDFQHFGLFTYVTVVSECKIVKLLERDNATFKKLGTHKQKSKETNFCIARKLYEEKKDKPFSFVIMALSNCIKGSEDKFEAVSSKFFKAYQSGVGWKVEFADWHIDLLQALKDEKFERIVKNRYSNNHTLLNVKDEIVYHRVRFDHISSQLNESNYNVDKLVKHLKKRKDVTNVDVAEIPYYNSDYDGERAVEFTYVPPVSRWSQFVEWFYPDNFNSRYTLFKKLGIEKFREKKRIKPFSLYED